MRGGIETEIVFTDYIKAELLVLIPVLYAVGEWIKTSKIDNRYIPLILGVSGIVLSIIYVLPVSDLSCGWRGVLLSIFTAVTQGVLCAAASVYANQLIKQMSNSENKTGQEDKVSKRGKNKTKK
jgi:FtsH-binding integral membrane protein